MSTQASELSPRMRLILESAARVVAAKGMRGLTHRAVDGEAGLPVGSTSGYLRTRLALTTALAAFISDALIDNVEGLVGRQRAGMTTEELTQQAIELFVGWLATPTLLLAQGELTQEAARVPEVAAALDPAKCRVQRLVRELLTTAGVEGDSQTDAEALVAAMQGVLASAFVRPREEREAYVRGTARRIVEAFVRLPAGPR